MNPTCVPIAGVLLSLVMWTGCTTPGDGSCTPGQLAPCACEDGGTGLQRCTETSEWDPPQCICATPEAYPGQADESDATSDFDRQGGDAQIGGEPQDASYPGTSVEADGLDTAEATETQNEMDSSDGFFEDVGGQEPPGETSDTLGDDDTFVGLDSVDPSDEETTTDANPESAESTPVVPLYDATTVLDMPVQEWTEEGLITRFADRARDRHAREDEFEAYDHYLPLYWEYRTVAVEVLDTIPAGGSTITFDVTTQWKLQTNQSELRFFYLGMNTVAEYYNNGIMTPLSTTEYTRTVDYNPVTAGPLQVGDRMEFELSQFLDAVPSGRNNYYGTAFLYIVGEGLVPWEARGTFEDKSSEREDSFPIPAAGWLGGNTTLPYAYSGEDDNHFLQMATNLSSIHGQTFVEGRRVHHTSFVDGTHNESDENPVFGELNGRIGSRYVNGACVACHTKNGRALPPESPGPVPQYVFPVGDGSGDAHPTFGNVLQPASLGGQGEPTPVLEAWEDIGSLRKPIFGFEGEAPVHYSPRIAPQLVGMGLLEAIPEAAILALADPDDADGDGISGRPRLVTDVETGDLRLGRLGWKADQPSVRGQVASALRTDMGVMTSVYPLPDCGPEQEECGEEKAPLSESLLDKLVAYNSLLGVRARRALDDPDALAGEALFEELNCSGCHTPSFVTSPYHPRSELRSQAISPYTDLLLHDMGEGLADTLPLDGVLATEWRTPPLWGIGLTAGVSGGEGYLHDGRARTLEEAIVWHGGEAEQSREAFEQLSEEEQQVLMTFLRSL